MSSQKEIAAWLKLANTEGIGAIGFAKLLQTYGSAENALDFLTQRDRKTIDDAWVENELSLADKYNIRIILQKDDLYPPLLRQLRDAPPILYAKGRIELLQATKTLAIVGSRNSTLNARNLTSQIAFDLTENNVLIISGMARGIDTAAHLGALQACNQKGPTIAVLGTGVDQIYPPENRNLYERIAEQGLLLSEMPLSTTALGGSFPRRNRIISGLSRGVLVTEASEKSGSLITARFAVEQKRMLFAIPGSPSDPRSAGPNKLLRAGAHLIENARDILKILDANPEIPQIPMQIDFCQDLFTNPLDNSIKTADIPDCPQNPITEFLSTEPVDIDEIIRATGLNTADVMMQILELEINGCLIRLPGNKIALKAGK